MYFPIGWPKILDTTSLNSSIIRKIICDRVKILFAIITDDTVSIWYTKPCVPMISLKRTPESLEKYGPNVLIEWKPDSTMLVVATTDGTLLIYTLKVDDTTKGIYNQLDPPHQNLRRDSAELFVKEAIPTIILSLTYEIPLFVPLTCICCVSISQMMIATKSEKVLRIRWDGKEDRDFSLDLRRIPFSINQEVSNAIPITENNTYITSMDYSPLIGGFSITLNDGRAAYLTANNLKFDPNQVQGIWAQTIDDATCCSINHKYRLIAFGRKNSQSSVYTIDDVTGGLELSHTMILSAKDFPGAPGSVREMKWTPDGCAVILSWSKGGISLWSTFGTMLMCSLGWDYGLHVDLANQNPLNIHAMDWSTEGYQLFMLRYEKQLDECIKNKNPDHASSQSLSSIMPPMGSTSTPATTSQSNKQLLTHTYSGSSEKSVNSQKEFNNVKSTLVQLDFVKSTFAINPCMSFHPHLFLQSDDKLYINQGDSLQKIYRNSKSFSMDSNLIDPTNLLYSSTSSASANVPNGKHHHHHHGNIFAQSYNNIYMSVGNPINNDVDGGGGEGDDEFYGNDRSSNGPDGQQCDDYEIGKSSLHVTSMLSESKHWIVVQLPIAYMSTNWPIRYSAIDKSGTNITVAGRTGVAIYSMTTRKWKLFGNETQEKDFIVTGGLLWWNDFIVMGCYSLVQQKDELRLYPKDCKLDNRFVEICEMSAPVMLINLFKDQLVVYTADNYVTIFALRQPSTNDLHKVELVKLHNYNIRGQCVHPACVVSVTMTNLKNDAGTRASQGALLQQETIVLNVSGRISMLNRENNGNSAEQFTTTCLASCVECLWVSDSNRSHLKESLWLYCGGHGMRVWLPVFPRESDGGHGSHRHTFMSKRIMLSFSLKVYPLAILFEDAIILGVENDTVLYTSDTMSHFSLPYNFLERTSQVYLHQILRHLIRRNLGYNAWEIARSCTNLPYFPHSLELLLHEVLEEEATSKEPIPDALLPSVLEFIQEFPVYLQTVVQCARKTEIALWPYLFATAGKPKELFQQCLTSRQLETAASYLIILQNLEPSSISRQFATILLETALEERKWNLAKDLVRFLRAIDPNDVESPRSSFVMGNKLGLTAQTPPVNANAEDLSLILGSMARGRSFSTTITPKSNDLTIPVSAKEKSIITSNVDISMVQRRKKSLPPSNAKEKDSTTAEEFFIEIILQRHARRLLQEKKIEALGYMSAALDFHLVGWLAREKDRAARIEDFVATLKQLHDDLDWPKPSLDLTKCTRRSMSERSISQQESPSYSLQSYIIDTNIGTGDSGYTSCRTNSNFELPISNDYQQQQQLQQQSYNILNNFPLYENHHNNVDLHYLYNPDLSNIALQNMNLTKLNDLSRISEEATTTTTNDETIKFTTQQQQQQQQQQHHQQQYNKYISNAFNQKISSGTQKGTNNSVLRKESITTLTNNEIEAKLLPLETGSVTSEQVSLWGEDTSSNANVYQDLDPQFNKSMDTLSIQNTRQISRKLEVKIRYLLQIFTEANCLEFSLVLSILLLDSASICRITDTAIRTGSLAVCRQLRNGLKDITRWSFQECLGYRPFMMVLQPQVNILDKYVIQQESIPNLLTPAVNTRFPQQNLYKINEHLDQFTKNTQLSISTNNTAIKEIQQLNKYEQRTKNTPLGDGNLIIDNRKLGKMSNISNNSNDNNMNINDTTSNNINTINDTNNNTNNNNPINNNNIINKNNNKNDNSIQTSSQKLSSTSSSNLQNTSMMTSVKGDNVSQQDNAGCVIQ